MLDQSRTIQHLGERGVRSLFNLRNAGNFREPWGGARLPNLLPEAYTGTNQVDEASKASRISEIMHFKSIRSSNKAQSG